MDTRADKLAAFLAQPDLMERIYAHVANGGALTEFCSSEVRYCDLAAWIQADAARAKRLSEAKAARNEWCDEELLRDLRKIALAPLDSETVPLRDKLRAIELQMKYRGMLTEKREITGTLTLADLVAESQGDKSADAK